MEGSRDTSIISLHRLWLLAGHLLPSLFGLCSSFHIMDLKVTVFFMASLLLVTARVSTQDEASLTEVSLISAPGLSPAPLPTLAPHLVIDARKECPGVCLGRCKLHSRQNVCNRACNTCCYVCKCVPPGTYGNRELCGKCYTAWTTHNNRTKCP